MISPKDVMRKNLKIVHGYPITYAFASSLEKIEQFHSRLDDIVIATYPKSGEFCGLKMQVWLLSLFPKNQLLYKIIIILNKISISISQSSHLLQVH